MCSPHLQPPTHKQSYKLGIKVYPKDRFQGPLFFGTPIMAQYVFTTSTTKPTPIPAHCTVLQLRFIILKRKS